MTLTRELEMHAAVLELIERRRRETGDQYLGITIEQCILDRQIAALETDIVENPGALEAMLVPVRRRRS